MRFLNHSLLLSSLFTPIAMAAPVSPQTACVSMQGNGERYPALIAQVLALLERNVEPKVIFGGSSASGAAALLRGILENPSVKNTIVIAEGRELSLAEKAARIVATTPAPIGTGSTEVVELQRYDTRHAQGIHSRLDHGSW